MINKVLNSVLESYFFQQLLDNSLLKWTLGNRFVQPFAEILGRVSLASMNMGWGNNVHKSGECWVLDFLSSTRFRNKNVVIFDCGANMGEYAFEVIKRLGDSCELYCFEPNEHACSYLKDRFIYSDNVHIYDIGLGDREEPLTLFSDDDEMSEMASLYKSSLDHRRIQMAAKGQVLVSVLVSTIDLFCSRH